MAKGSKRLRKKKSQQQQRANLKQSGYSEKQIRNIKGAELQKASAKVDTKRRYDENRAFLLSQGIDRQIISQQQLYRRSDKFLHDKENIKKWRKESRELVRYRKFIDAGFKPEEIKKSWLRYDKITNRVIMERLQYEVVYFDKYLVLQYADILGDSTIDPEQFKDYTFEEIKNFIRNSIMNALRTPDDSGSFHGAFRMISGRDKFALRQAARDYERRGYNIRVGKFSKNAYTTVTIKNDFTPREFAEMVLIVLNNSSNKDAIYHYKYFQRYAMECDNELIRNLLDVYIND